MLPSMDALLLALADASPQSVLLNMGLPGVVILGLAYAYLLERRGNKELRDALAEVQALRVADAQARVADVQTGALAMAEKATTLVRETTTAMNSTAAGLTAFREAIQTHTEALRDLTDTVARKR